MPPAPAAGATAPGQHAVFAETAYFFKKQRCPLLFFSLGKVIPTIRACTLQS